MRAYVVINSHTAVNTLEAISQDIDHLLIMTVNPGFIGQSFIDDAYRKIELNRHLIKKNSAQKTIQVDGGVNQTHAGKPLFAGTDIFVAGKFVFGSDHPGETISDLKYISNGKLIP